MTDARPLVASQLREHTAAVFLLDGAAAAKLTPVATPWALGNVNWTATLIKNALESTTGAEVNQWLNETFGKPMPQRTTPIRTRAHRRANKKQHEPSIHNKV